MRFHPRQPFARTAIARAPFARTAIARPAIARAAFARSAFARTAIALGAALGLAACNDAGARVSDDGVPLVTIGVGALPGKPGYEDVVHGVQLAIERLDGEAAGRLRFAMRLPDDSTTSAVALAVQLRDDPSVTAVVGHPESGNSVAAIPVYADLEGAGRNALPAVSPTATSPALTGISDWFFRVAPSDADGARDVARYVHDSLGASTAAIIFRNDAYGRDWAHAFEAAFVADGGDVLLADPYLTGETDWSLYGAHVAMRAPDVVLFPGDADDAQEFLRALRASGSTARFIGGDGTAAIAQQAGEFAGDRYVTFYEPAASASDEARRFLAAWAKKVGGTPDMFGALSYDAALAIGRAALRAKSPTRRAVRDGLVSVRFEGVAGPLAFDPRTHDVRGRSVRIATVTP